MRNPQLYPHSMRLRNFFGPRGEESCLNPVSALSCPQKGRFVAHYSSYNPPGTKGDSGPSLDGQDLQVPRNREGVHPGLAVRPRTPGPHPLPGGFNETALESYLIRGLLVVQIHWSWHEHPQRWFVPPRGCSAEFLY